MAGLTEGGPSTGPPVAGIIRKPAAMNFFLQIAASGISTGAIYGLIAVGYSLTFMTTKVLNFALGMWVMLGGMLTYSLVVQYHIPACLFCRW